MRMTCLVCGVLLAWQSSFAWSAPRISGEYLESRSCDVYTGPCFANGELGLTGREALMAWKVDRGEWDGISLDGLSVAVAVLADDTLGENAGFRNKPQVLGSVLLIDQKATPRQQQALQRFVQQMAPKYTQKIAHVAMVPMTLENDHLQGRGLFRAGDVARMETRKVAAGDCICTNEAVFYPPLSKVQNSQPAYCLESSFQSDGLGTTWTLYNKRSAFLATFRL